MDLIKDVIPSEHVVLQITNGEKHTVIGDLKTKDSPLSEDFRRRVIQGVLNSQCPAIFISQDHSQWSCSERTSERENNHHILCFPLVDQNNPIGVLYLGRHVRQGPYTDKNLDLMAELAKPVLYILKHFMNVFGEQSPPCPSGETALVGRSERFTSVLQMMERVKNIDVPVFIWGESGTGKELIARTIHETGCSRRGKFIAVNCGAIPDHLLESELFGYVKGAFTGALRDKPGLVEEAHGGAFFLDEIGDLSLSLQAKLLRLLQEKEFRRVGDNRIRRVDVRFISATNKNIEREVARGRFREDLYYRLKIFTVEIPPLRERQEDILALLNFYVAKYCQQMNRGRAYFSPQSLELLLNHHWPGNVRELQNEIQRCLVLCGDGSLIKEEHLSLRINPHREVHHASSYDYFRAKADFEKRFLNQALSRFRYNRVKTAAQLGLSRQGLFKLIKKHNIAIPKRTTPEIAANIEPDESKNEDSKTRSR